MGDHDASLSDAGETSAEAISGSSSTFASGTGKAGIINSLLTGGSSGSTSTPTVGELDTAYTLFADTMTVDVNLVMDWFYRNRCFWCRWCNTRN